MSVKVETLSDHRSLCGPWAGASGGGRALPRVRAGSAAAPWAFGVLPCRGRLTQCKPYQAKAERRKELGLGLERGVGAEPQSCSRGHAARSYQREGLHACPEPLPPQGWTVLRNKEETLFPPRLWRPLRFLHSDASPGTGASWRQKPLVQQRLEVPGLRFPHVSAGLEAAVRSVQGGETRRGQQARRADCTPNPHPGPLTRLGSCSKSLFCPEFKNRSVQPSQGSVVRDVDPLGGSGPTSARVGRDLGSGLQGVKPQSLVPAGPWLPLEQVAGKPVAGLDAG